MKYYMDKQEKWDHKNENPITYIPIDVKEVLHNKGFKRIISQNLMFVADSGTVYYGYMLGSYSYFKRLDRFMSKIFIERHFPIDNDKTKKGYCEVSEELVLGYLNSLNNGERLKEDGGQYNKVITKIRRVLKNEKQKIISREREDIVWK